MRARESESVESEFQDGYEGKLNNHYPESASQAEIAHTYLSGDVNLSFGSKRCRSFQNT
jgi:hypothetical protein